jgi:hypothetical protein
MKKPFLFCCILTLYSLGSFAQINLWLPAAESTVTSRTADDRYTTPSAYGLYKLDLATLKVELANVPFEREVSARNSYAEFQFPMPDGSFRNFHVIEYEMMESGLARKYNHIKTYIGVDHKYGSKIHFNLTHNQLFGAIRENGVTYFIDPYFKNNGEYYLSYDIRNNKNENQKFECGVHEILDGELIENEPEILDEIKSDKILRGNRGEALKLKSYRLAVSGTFEFTDYHGGTVMSAMEAIVVIVNRLNSVFEREAAIRLVLVNNNDQLIFTSSDDDPFEDGNLGQMINQNQGTIDGIIGTQNYDIGHVFGRAFLQGLAQLGAVCSGGSKARGGSVFNPPIGDPFVISIIAHEMGHQFNASHTMYHCHNVNTPTAYEIGSGSTIMSYAGICNGQSDIQNNADDYYHANSLESIIRFSRNGGGTSCGMETDFGNTYPDPILNYPSQINIPVNTPFRLTGSATDAEDASTLTYNWDQYQSGSRLFQSDPWDISQPIGNEPIFRSVPPSSDPTRYFPALPRVVNGINYLFEQLPTYARDLKFRFIVRDNAAENGGTAWRDVDIKVYDNSAAGKFEITNFNTQDSIKAGDYVEINWNVAKTDSAPFNTKFVDIYLSRDGGSTFPFLIKSNTKNDGSTFVNIPNEPTNRFRVMVAASNNIYFDVNNRSGVIVPQRDEAIGVSYDDQCFQICAPDLVEFDINAFGLGGYEGPVHFDFTGAIPSGGSVKFTDNDIMAGSSTKLRFDLRDAVESGTFDLSFMVSGEGIDTLYRTIETVVVINDFESLILNEPINGSSGNAFVPTLQWSASPNASNYTVELSDVADFSNILFSKTNVLNTEITLDLQLDAGGVYFWRVKPRNACGLLDINQVSSFQVQSLSCEEYCSTEPDIIIPGSGTHIIEMNINTGVSITASDLNVTKIDGRHQDMGQLVFTLEGPNGGQVVLLDRQCGFTNTNFNMGFDDDAAISAPNCVNFDEGLRYVPEGNLSDFNGVNGSNYKLIVEDKVSGQSGLLESWCFEICGDISPEKPLLVVADTIQLFNLESRIISSDKLQVTHSQYNAGEISLTIVEAPSRGRLLYDGVPIENGSILSMQDILDNKLIYQNESTLYDMDHFSFVATDPGGGFLGTPRINFFIGLTATQTALPIGSELLIYPNPAKDFIQLKLISEQLYMEEINVYSIQGSLLSTIKVNSSNEANINLNQYSSGIYLVQVRSGNYSVIRKFIKQ